MFKNFILLAYRHFIRSPLTSFIELFGMTAGLTVFLLVLLWVSNETGYDKFNEKADRIYRLEEIDADNKHRALHPTILRSLLTEGFPEIKNAVRIRYMKDASQVYKKLEKGEKNYYETDARMFVDSDFFDVFTFEFIAGNPETALTEINTGVITESLAKSMFDTENAMGQIMYDEEHLPIKITGIIKDSPHFHIRFNMLRSFESLK